MNLKLLTRLHFGIQRDLLPALEEVTEPLSDKDKRFVKVCELLRLEKQVHACGWKGFGRPPKSHLNMAHAFVAKALWNIPTTKALIGQLRANTTLQESKKGSGENGTNLRGEMERLFHVKSRV
jgi:hypothetical protein